MKEKLKNRYVISIILVIAISIIGFLVNGNSFEWLLNTGEKFTPWFNIKFFGLLLAGYELFLIVTKENKTISKFGSVIIAFSGLVAYNHTKIDSLLFGAFIVVFINKLLESDSKRNSILFWILTVLFCIMYSYTFVPYAISFGYVFLAIIVYILCKDRKSLKDKKVYLISLLIVSVFLMIISKFIYPNTYLENEDLELNGFSLLYTYMYSPLLPFFSIEKAQVLSSIISLWPLPILASLYYLYKNEKHTDFLLPVTTIAVIEIVFTLVKLPEIVQKIFLLGSSNPIRMVAGVQLSCVIIMLYFLSNIKEKLLSTSASIRTTILLAFLLIFVAFPRPLSGNGWLTFYVMEHAALMFSFFNMDKKEYRLFFLAALAIITVISGIPVYF